MTALRSVLEQRRPRVCEFMAPAGTGALRGARAACWREGTEARTSDRRCACARGRPAGWLCGSVCVCVVPLSRSLARLSAPQMRLLQNWAGLWRTPVVHHLPSAATSAQRHRREEGEIPITHARSSEQRKTAGSSHAARRRPPGGRPGNNDTPRPSSAPARQARAARRAGRRTTLRRLAPRRRPAGPRRAQAPAGGGWPPPFCGRPPPAAAARRLRSARPRAGGSAQAQQCPPPL